ncbi:hypothetical protein NMG60_11031388 [Bertholletia excelsa]
MQQVSGTIEEHLLVKSIKDECSWEILPKRVQSILGTKEEWNRRMVEHCIKKRLQWKSSLAGQVMKEGEYYEEMIRYLRKNLALFPYHLAEYVCRVMRLSPFRYYCDMIFEVMKNEQPYDSIPNFSAADALRLTGVGRNEFIDIMNKCKSKKFMWKLNKSIVKELLPTQPVDFVIEPWWEVCLVNFTLEEFRKLSEEEMATIDKVCKEEANAFILFDPDITKGLYRRGLIYFDVPVYSDDRFKVSRLEGFVSNREQSYEDPIEELLYAVFVVSSENSTVAQLASTLQADLYQLEAAASFACRLGWAVKLTDPSSVLRDSISRFCLHDEEDGSRASTCSLNLPIQHSTAQQGDISGTEDKNPSSTHTHVAFVVDANITSYLMMGSVSPGLKSHAVTLYEAGKLGHTSIADLCNDLSTLEGKKFEGELQEFANHAFSLRCVLECLATGGVPIDEKDVEVCDKTSTLSSTYVEPASVTEVTLTDISRSTDRDDAVVNKDDSMTPRYEREDCIRAEPVTDQESSATMSEEVNCLTEDSKSDPSIRDDEKLISVQVLNGEKEPPRRKRTYHVNILRCESLAALSPATLERLFCRDYGIVISMIPLPLSSVLPGPKGPIHFGPPCHSAMTPWMKLVLYSVVATGPLSVVLVKGQCLRLLPAPLAGCEKAIIWSWDGSMVGGLGGKFGGNLVKGSVLLHCLNSILKHSAVLVQPLSKYDIDEQGRMITMDLPLPLKDSDGSIALIGKELDICTEESSKLNSLLADLANKIELRTIGYIRLLKLYKGKELDQLSPHDQNYEWVPLSMNYGIPLFNPKLCGDICKRVVASQILQTNLLPDHQEAMQFMRTRLRDICNEYQPTGQAAKLLYQKGQPNNLATKLMTYASGRWSPLVDPCSPISGAVGEQTRSKLANRQRFHTEVLSFDGSTLRSYALTPSCETGARSMEDSLIGSPENVETDDTHSREVNLPGINLIFDGRELRPFDIGACLQAHPPVCLIADASSASACRATKLGIEL